MKPIHNSRLLLVSLVLLQVSTLMALMTPATEAIEKKARDICVKELKLTEVEINLLDEDKWFRANASDPSANMMCYFACYYKQIAVITSNGSQNPDVLLKYAQHLLEEMTKNRPIMKKCSAIKSNNDCEQTYKIERCVRESM